MKPDRWIEVTPSEYAWEHEALEYLKARLPDGEPFRAWSNFEFIAGDGSVNEVDLLVVSLHKVYLVEIKSWSGAVSGDSNTWRREVDGRVQVLDSPLLLANRKAKKLGTILKAQKALARKRRPFIEAIVFLSRMGVRCHLEGRARTGVHLAAETDPVGHFGSGKRHFMAVPTLLLRGDTLARSILEIAGAVAKANAWTTGRRFLVVPYRLIGATSMESAILGHYAEQFHMPVAASYLPAMKPLCKLDPAAKMTAPRGVWGVVEDRPCRPSTWHGRSSGSGTVPRTPGSSDFTRSGGLAAARSRSMAIRSQCAYALPPSR